ncbi:MAB_1171c family putative transporter [Streptomyces sp. NPDC006879]|uniref:MAB_1171c family putative transporter n=1 Tax=Streptomyces sp. NPDC006879 TaxID=3364767 RepID=UPI00369DC63D
MSSDDIAQFGNALAVPGVIALWLAVLARSRAALHSPQQRGLWLAVATAAAAMTLNLPAVVELATEDPGSAHLVALTRNFIGVLSAGAVLYFVAATTSGRRLQTASWVTATLLLLGLLGLDFASADHGAHGIPPQGSPVPSLAYWLTLIGAHLLANTVCVYVCWRYSRVAESRALSAGLQLFGLGTALAGLFWLGYLVKALSGAGWPLPYLPLLMNLHAFLRAAAILVPTLFTLRRTVAEVTAAWRLWPLWSDLVQAVPHVALNKPRARLWELLWPPMPRQLLVYRKVIETRDAILLLADYVAPEVPDLAREHVRGSEAGADGEAAVLACVIRRARAAKLAGDPQQQGGFGAGAFGGHGLEDEKQFLMAVAAAYTSPAARSFSARS